MNNSKRHVSNIKNSNMAIYETKLNPGLDLRMSQKTALPSSDVEIRQFVSSGFNETDSQIFIRQSEDPDTAVSESNFLSIQVTRPSCSSLLIIQVFRNQCRSKMSRLILFFISWFSHHIRDANRRGMWFGPFCTTPSLHDGVYHAFILITPLIVRYVYNSGFCIFLHKRNLNAKNSTHGQF
ncbi:hypothetical protein BpHYR1_026156 [Brachionus plicatilis]|uniref:Transmembrane protein 267 n=1 Tax=Brachionus plicatilis TaxID=10195 RepID=A0A3M7T7P6_BRAPC|nr:hypothetical protein BpHYR1_026156 [Brachionus plicatilis]